MTPQLLRRLKRLERAEASRPKAMAPSDWLLLCETFRAALEPFPAVQAQVLSYMTSREDRVLRTRHGKITVPSSSSADLMDGILRLEGVEGEARSALGDALMRLSKE